MSMVPSLKRAAAYCLHRSGALRLSRALRQQQTAILLMYHRVNDDADPFFPSLPAAVFADQVEFVRRHYRVEPLDEVARWLRSGAAGAPRVALTFDDGYPDTHEVVAPILRRHRLPATLFLSTAPPEDGEPLWLDRLRALVKHTPATQLDCPALGLGPWPLRDVPERLRALGRLVHYLKPKDGRAIEAALAALAASLGGQSVAPPGVITWDQVASLRAGGFDIGAHTHRHYILSRQTPEAARDDVTRSMDLIESRLGERPVSFAYPNGGDDDHSPRTRQVLAELGLVTAVTTRLAFAGPGDDPLALPRLHTAADTLSLFASRVAGLGSLPRPRRGPVALAQEAW